MSEPAQSPTYPRWSICVCSCCHRRVQILKIDPERGAACYKVARYNAIAGGRHWVTEDQLAPFPGGRP